MKKTIHSATANELEKCHGGTAGSPEASRKTELEQAQARLMTSFSKRFL